ncbi:MAG: flagellar export chaperone FliS [Deltaproteobacteria bacterium]|nr:flagellar export chaperone FliS [Deltaproteobacteria bacterium]
MSMNMAGYDAYKKTQVQTADQGALILMCYDGAITFLKKAKKAYNEKDHAQWSTFLNKAQNILWELLNSLNYDAGEIAYNLESLYNYMIRRIVDADYHKNIAAADEVLAYLNDLRDSWVKITKKSS